MRSPYVSLLCFTVFGCSTPSIITPAPSDSPSPVASSSPLTREQALEQYVKPMVEALEAFRSANRGYPMYVTQLDPYLKEMPKNIAYRWVDDAPEQAYELVEVLANDQFGCVYSSITKSWMCPQ